MSAYVELVPKSKVPIQGDSLGEGTSGAVYAAEFERQGSTQPIQVACKFIKDVGNELPDLLKEIMFSVEFAHPRVVPLYGVCLDPSCFVLIMRQMQCSLDDLLHKENAAGNYWHFELSWLNRVDLLIDIIEGLEYMHGKGGVHRDLKPANVLIEFVRGKPRAYLADFGLARHVDDDGSGMTIHHYHGTPFYMAPELHASKPCTRASDMFAIGLMIFETAQRQEPWFDQEFSIGAVVTGHRPLWEHERTFPLPDYLNKLMVACWDDDPDKRPSAAEVLAQLRANRKVFSIAFTPEEQQKELEQDSQAEEATEEAIEDHPELAVYWDHAYRQAHQNADAQTTKAFNSRAPDPSPQAASSAASSSSSSSSSSASSALVYAGQSIENWSNAEACSQCDSGFKLTVRRHHCRKCGKSMCGQCFQWMYLDEQAATAVRTCKSCVREIEASDEQLAKSFRPHLVTYLTGSQPEPESGTGRFFSYNNFDCPAVDEAPRVLSLLVQWWGNLKPRYRVVARFPGSTDQVVPLANCQDLNASTQFVRMLTLRYERFQATSHPSTCPHGLVCPTLSIVDPNRHCMFTS